MKPNPLPHTFYSTTITTPLGDMVALADNQALYLLKFKDDIHINQAVEQIQTTYFAKIIYQPNQITHQVQEELNLYFHNKLTKFTISLKLTGTNFQKKCWTALLSIPYGQTASYLQQAIFVGTPKACRAVGTSNGKNHIAIMIPCHRIINANGKLGGYATGLDRKISLLTLESQDNKEK